MGQNRCGSGAVPDIGAVARCVAVQRATHRARNPRQLLQAAQSVPDRHGKGVGKLRAPPDREPVAFRRDVDELRRREVNHQAADAVVADQDVRPAAQQAHGHVLLAATLDQLSQFVDARRLGKVRGFTAQAKPCVRR
jgi:hypothetical protein